MHVVRRRLSETAGAYRTVFRNPSLRRVQLVYGTSIAAEWGAVVALAVFAYALRGAVGVGIVGIVRMLPAAVATPFVAVLSDRFPRERVLQWIELAAAAALAGSTAAFYAGQAEIPIYALAGLLAIFSTLLRPTLAALLPSLATTPEELLGGFRVVAQEPQPRLLIALFAAQTLVRGALNVLIVVLAFRLLHAGGSWVGFLTAAIGAGGLIGAFASVSLTGRRLAVPFGLGLLLWGLPIAALGLWPNKVTALVLLAIVGIGNSLEDVGGFTLLQRIVRDEVLARVLGVLWGLAMAGVGVGSVVGPPLIHAVGTRAAAAAIGLFLVGLVVVAWPRLVSIDRAVAIPAAELDGLEKVPMFRGLSVVAKERLAASLIALSFPAGAEIVKEGEIGDRFYIVVDGQIGATEGGRAAGRGSLEYFGEIALLRDVPRTATVTARTPVRLYALERDDFLAAVTGHSAVHAAGEAVIEERLSRAIQPD